MQHVTECFVSTKTIRVRGLLQRIVDQPAIRMHPDDFAAKGKQPQHPAFFQASPSAEWQQAEGALLKRVLRLRDQSHRDHWMADRHGWGI